MKNPSYTLTYPRRGLWRGGLRALGRVLLPLLTRTTITGRENFPAGGPLLVVGNHVAAIEAVLMIVYAPWQIEMLGAGDIPPPPAMDAIARRYGYTPIDRGNLDRRALRQVLDVLQQDGIVGVFPEGGIWEPGAKPAKRGVAWLSYRAQAPILPIGFGGLEGALNALFRLGRPRLIMNVGEVMPPVTLPAGVPRKQALRQAAARVMRAVEALIPPADRAQHPPIQDERFELRRQVRAADGTEVAVPAALTLRHPDALCKLFHRPAILRIFDHDLGLPVGALRELQDDAAALTAALGHILRYLDEENPAFFTYRFGTEEGLAMEAGLRELHALTQWAAARDYRVILRPIRRYRQPDIDEEIVEDRPGMAHRW